MIGNQDLLWFRMRDVKVSLDLSCFKVFFLKKKTIEYQPTSQIIRKTEKKNIYNKTTENNG